VAKEAMKRLDEQERHIIELRFYEGKTQHWLHRKGHSQMFS
jgi:DNA-directed RNA polymerase specialized sigma subunit